MYRLRSPDGEYGEEDYFSLLSMKDSTKVYFNDTVTLDNERKYKTHIFAVLLVNFAVLNQGERSRF